MTDTATLTRARNDCSKKAQRREVDPELLREFLRYDPETGKLFWRERDAVWFTEGRHCTGWNTRNAGREITHHSASGYLALHVLGTRYLAHRVIWAMANGVWPDDIDHIDGDGCNNKLSNLRSVTSAENMRNKARNKRNKSGHNGIQHHPKKGTTPERWTVEVNHKKLGRFFSLDEAIAARDAAARALGFHPNHGRPPIGLGKLHLAHSRETETEGAAASIQPGPNWLLRRVISDLAFDGEHRLFVIEAEYARRLALIARVA